MNSRCAVVTVALIGVLYATTSMACSWEGLTQKNSTRLLPGLISDSDVIVRGRVVRVHVDESRSNTATIEVIQSFKGGAKRLNVEGSLSFCGYSFTKGEDRIFFLKDGQAWVGGVYRPSPWLIRDLEKTLDVR